MNLADRLISSVSRRQPNFVIGGRENPYLIRWWVAPRNAIANAYVHLFKRSDDDRAHHNHPWLFRISIILRGAYTEHRILAGGIVEKRVLRAGMVSFAWGKSPHRVELHDGECWTLFITGPRVREWGFYCMERVSCTGRNSQHLGIAETSERVVTHEQAQGLEAVQRGWRA